MLGMSSQAQTFDFSCEPTIGSSIGQNIEFPCGEVVNWVTTANGGSWQRENGVFITAAQTDGSWTIFKGNATVEASLSTTISSLLSHFECNYNIGLRDCLMNNPNTRIAVGNHTIEYVSATSQYNIYNNSGTPIDQGTDLNAIISTNSLNLEGFICP